VTERRIAVGYTATRSGRVAVRAAARLARAVGGRIDLVIVLPDVARGAVVPPDPGYDALLRDSAATWLEEAAALIPADVQHRRHVTRAESAAEGLVAVADEIGASYLVVGAGSDRGLARYGVGTAASELLHTADVPVVVVPLPEDGSEDGWAAPAGAGRVDEPTVSRVTVAVGTRPGADVLLEEAATLARAAGAPLRLLSLQVLDLPGRLARSHEDVAQLVATSHLSSVLDELRATVPDVHVEGAEVAQGRDVTEAVEGLEWSPGEVTMVGSSRLAAPHRVFLGVTAAKLLRAVPVPVVVVPRTRPQGDRP
jgi:nucleotide-binding universal stress UspA family protein